MMRPYLGCASCSSAPATGGRGMGSVVMFDDTRAIIPVNGLSGISLPDTLLSPGAVVAALDDVNRHVTYLQTDITTNLSSVLSTTAGQRFYNDWVVFKSEWVGFYDTHSRGLRAALDYFVTDTVSGLRQRAAQFDSMEQRFTSLGFTPTDVGEPSSGESWLGVPVAAWIGIGVGTVALGFVAWGLSSVSKIAPATRAARALSGRRKQ